MTEFMDNIDRPSTMETIQPEFLKVDNRSLQELLQEFAAYAKQIPFEDELGNTLGNWDEMYTGHMLFLWAEISCLDIATLDQRKMGILELWLLDGETRAMDFLLEVLDILRELYDKAGHVDAEWVMDEITAVIRDSLYDHVSHILKHIEKTGRLDLHSWMDWAQSMQFVTSDQAVSGNTWNKKNTFREAVNDGLNCLFILQNKIGGSEFEESLYSGEHPAHLGLLFGFLKSYQAIQMQLNKLPKRHIDFYYKTILKQSPLSPKPDLAHLFFTLVPGRQQAVIDKGVSFFAGLDADGDDMIFKTKAPVVLTSAKITELRTLLFDKNKDVRPLHRAAMITGAFMDIIPITSIDKTLENHKAWALCGEPQHYHEKKKLPEIGWAIASPIFNLSSGERTLELSFRMTKESIEKSPDMSKLSQDPENDLNNVSRDEMLNRFLNNALEIQITTKKGWLTVDDYAIIFTEIAGDKKKPFKINFSLSPQMPAWVPYNVSVHGPDFTTELPLIRFKLKQETVYYPYSLLKELKIEALDIKLIVNGFSDLIIYNKHGMVDTTNPFPILGMNPLMGNLFHIGAREWQHKNLTHLKCNINWMDLPKPNFETYYNSYGLHKITDASFKIALVQGSNAQKSPQNLFALDDGRLVGKTVIKNDFVHKAVDQKKTNETALFDPKKVPTAFVGMELLAPEVGFGSAIYLEEMARYGQNIISKGKKKDVPLPPKKPFIPIAESIEVDYGSSHHIPFESISNILQTEPFDFFHIHPYGTTKEGNEKDIREKGLLPNYDAKGYLFIGLEQAKPFTEISIFLKLIPSEEPLREDIKLSIEYLSGREWSDLGEKVIENSTIAGQETGIIRLFLPRDLESNHPLFAKNKDWIRISVDSAALDALGKCVYINTNVAVVERTLKDGNQMTNSLPPLSISGLMTKKAFVQSVVQPFYSYGGAPKEKESRFYSRIANRLGHKNRMVRARDYERMILEKFPEVNWIKVLSASKYGNSRGDDRVDPGTIKLIVMPKIEISSDRSSYHVPKNTQLRIKEYVQAHCAPGLSISVESPNYEEIEVRCRLERKKEHLFIPYEEIATIIKKQIAPWLYDKKTRYQHLQRKFSVGNLVHALCQHSNVGAVSWCQVVHISNRGKGHEYFDSFTGTDIIRPTNGKAILIPAIEFKIYQSGEENANYGKLSIQNMDIDQTFILRADKGEKNQEVPSHLAPKSKKYGKRYVLNLKNFKH